MVGIKISGRTAAYSKDKFPVKYKYSSLGKKTTRVSSNLSSIGVASL